MRIQRWSNSTFSLQALLLPCEALLLLLPASSSRSPPATTALHRVPLQRLLLPLRWPQRSSVHFPPKEQLGFSRARPTSVYTGETRSSAEASFDNCPATWIGAASSRLSGSKLSATDRARRTWKAGQWARAVQQGRVSSPFRTEAIDLPNRVWCVVRGPQGGDPQIFHSSREFFAFVLTAIPFVTPGHPRRRLASTLRALEWPIRLSRGSNGCFGNSESQEESWLCFHTQEVGILPGRYASSAKFIDPYSYKAQASTEPMSSAMAGEVLKEKVDSGGGMSIKGAQGRVRLQQELALHRGTFFNAVTSGYASAEIWDKSCGKWPLSSITSRTTA